MTHSQPQILIHQIHHSVTADKPLFKSLSLNLGSGKTGLVGRNGIGKSTLFRLITGESKPDAGSIQVRGSLAYSPQELLLSGFDTVAAVLGIRNKTDALSRIMRGSIAEEDFQIIGDDWTVTERIHHQLSAFGLGHIQLDRPASGLSGGELTRLLLARVFLSEADIILLDEPTNNLDVSARNMLYEAILSWNKGLLVISHDRNLLNLMNQIVELTALGANIYGGNYDDYLEQKKLLQDAAERELFDAKKALDNTRQSVQTTRERSEQKRSRGRKLFVSGKIDKMFANSQKGRSERTQNRLVKQNENMIDRAEKNLEEAKSKIEIIQDIHVSLPATHVPNGKMIIDIQHLTFAYPGQRPIIEGFDLILAGPERIALTGDNGSGKTTLVKLILGSLTPSSGMVSLGTTHVSYLDQRASTLKPDLSVLDNFLLLNPEVNINEAHAALAKFLFRNTAAHQIVKHLSGGEKLRAELACALMSKHPPLLLILDEPTNHLDLESIHSIETALNNYQGALLVISHDRFFLDKIKITRFIHAPYRTI